MTKKGKWEFEMSQPQPTTVSLHVAGATAGDVKRELAELAKAMGSDPLADVDTEALLAELRDRLAKNGQVVRIVPFADENSSGGGTGGEPATRTRKARADKATPPATEPAQGSATNTPPATEPAATATATPPATTATTPTAAPVTEATTAVADAPTTAPTATPPSDTGTAPAAKTLDDVKGALNAFSAVKGQAAARQIMQDKGGSMRLMDIPPANFGALVDELNAQAKAPATQAA